MVAQPVQWIVRSRPQPHLRLFCFPYAGGGASIYRLWSASMPEEIEVCPVYLPGRENRLGERPFTRLLPLVQLLGYVLHPYMDIPFAFFGYSMGALIGFELARYLCSTQSQGPLHLFVAADRAPQLPHPGSTLHTLPDAEFIRSLYQLGGTPAAVLQNEELMQVLLPVLRADFTLYETYRYVDEPPLDCPITAFGGEQDQMVSKQDLAAWREQTSHEFTLHMLPGNHFFLATEQQTVLQGIKQALNNR
jgi:medium-chain acyl-[acyl-carrier-protein] hydrolase